MAAIDVDGIRSAAVCGPLAIETVEQTGSTNRVLMDTAFQAAPTAPRLLVTGRQSTGRGRRGRHWIMEPGRSAAFSIAIERFAGGPRPSVGLSIAAGVAAACALATLVPEVRLKWPNDLQRAGCKFGGILVESRRGPSGLPGALPVERFVIGVGLNLLAPQDPEERIDQPATGLFEGAELPVPAELVIGRVAGAIVDATRCFLGEGLEPFRKDWDRFDALRGEQVALLEGARVQTVGIARGIDDSGALLLETGTGMQAVTSGDVSVRTTQALRSARQPRCAS